MSSDIESPLSFEALILHKIRIKILSVTAFPCGPLVHSGCSGLVGGAGVKRFLPN